MSTSDFRQSNLAVFNHRLLNVKVVLGNNGQFIRVLIYFVRAVEDISMFNILDVHKINVIIHTTHFIHIITLDNLQAIHFL